MSSENEYYSRLSALMEKLGYTENAAEITAVADGCSYVAEKLDDIFSELFIDTMGSYGKAMMCNLFSLKSFDAKEIKKDMSEVFSLYESGDMDTEFAKYNEYCTVSCTNGKILVLSYAHGNRQSLYKMYPFFEKYLCPGVIAGIKNCSYTFDDFDGFDFNADKWNKIGECTFNFVDSMGGEA